MPSTPERIVVSNTSPLLYLYQVGHIDLLRELYGRIRIPSAVRMELQTGAEQGVAVPDASALGWIDEQVLTDRILLPAVVDLGPGEAEAIALALSSPDSLLILDDRLGRRIARLSGVTYTGTLGVLLKAKQVGLLPSVAPVIEQLQETTMHLTPELIEMVLKDAGEA
jgi:predicted nucleic acid-binding protein